jgi:hypothetical protein
MTRCQQLLTATALLAAFGLAGPVVAADATKQSTEEAVGTRHVADPGVEHLKEGTGCIDAEASNKTLSANQTTTQTAPRPCPADEPKSQ